MGTATQLKIISILLFLCPIPALSQSVSGVIIDSLTHEPVGYASVSLFINTVDDTPVTGAISDTSGFFRLETIRKGDYILRINCTGYYLKEITVSVEESNIDLKNIELKINEFVLEEVTVIGKKRAVILKPDKKIVTVDDAMASSGESLAEMLKILPEIRVENDNITLKNQSFSVYINGKPASISSRQLFQIPVSTVEKVEVMTNPSVKYSPDGLGGIVNIITKQRLSGINGVIQAAAKTDNNYGGAFMFNYGLKKLNLFTTFFPRYFKTNTDGYSNTVTNNVGTTEEKLFQQSKYFSESFKLGFDWDITDDDLATVYWSQWYANGTYTSNIASKSDRLHLPETIMTNTNNNSGYLQKNNTLSLNYKHLFKKKGTEFSFDFMQSFSDAPQDREFRITDENGIPITTTFRVFPCNDNQTSNITSSFVTVLSEKINLNMDAGIDLIFNRERERYSGETLKNNSWKDSADIRNSFRLNEYISGIYLLLGFNIRKFEFKLGSRAEYYHSESGLDILKNNISECNLYPSFAVSYVMNDYHTLNVNYNRRIERPAIYSLSPIAHITDYLTEMRVGNENLQPVFSNSFELGYLFDKNDLEINASLSYINTKNDIEMIYYNIGEIRYRRDENIADRKTLMFDGGLNWRYKKISAYLMGSVYNNNYRKKTQESIERSNHWSYNIRFIPRLRLNNDYNFNLQLIYYGTRYYAYSKVTESLQVSLNASKTIKNLTFSLRAINLVNKIFRRYSWSDSYTNETFFDNHDTALFHIGILYKFGKETKTRAQTDLNNRPIQLNS
jgi:outer membrane receptor for ferrienterochelin and colicin